MCRELVIAVSECCASRNETRNVNPFQRTHTRDDFRTCGLRSRRSERAKERKRESERDRERERAREH